MAYRLPPFPALRAFEAAARSMSFKAAADELHVTPAAVSQQIRTLEDYLDLQLFIRLPRRLELTAEAEAMLPKLREAFACLAAAVEATRQPGGALSVSAPPNFALRWLLPRLPDFSATHSEIEVRLSSSRGTIDGQSAPLAGSALPVDPSDEHTGLSIRFGEGRAAGHRCDALLSPDYTLVCSPSLLLGKRPLRTPADLRWHELIHDESIPDEAIRPSWEAWLRKAGAPAVDATRGPRFGNTTLAIEAALAGQGVVLAQRQLLSRDIAAGRLAAPFPDTVSCPFFYYLATPEAIAGRAVVQAFRRWLLHAAAEHAVCGDLTLPAPALEAPPLPGKT